MNYVYKKTEPRLWTVGFYDPDGKFEPESDHGSADQAARRVHYLHGGEDPDPVQAASRELLAVCKAFAQQKLRALVATTGLGEQLDAAIAKAEGNESFFPMPC